MRILLYSPDNGVTRNFMPHLWMFLLQTLTTPGHEVLLIDGNARPIDEAAMARFVQEQKIGLVGIGAMTRMVAKAYRMADAFRAAGVPVVMGGPHVTEEPDEALGCGDGKTGVCGDESQQCKASGPKSTGPEAPGQVYGTAMLPKHGSFGITTLCAR